MKTVKELIIDKKLANVVAKDESGSLSSLMPMFVVKVKSDNTDNAELTRDSYRPNAKQLAIINKTALITKDADSGYVLTFQATNNISGNDKGIDRSQQAFSEKALKSMAKYAELNTIPFLLASEADWGDHTWKAVNVYGFCIKAYSDGGALFYDMFFPKNDVTKEALDRLFDGLVSKGSVGFSYMYEDLLCSSCMKSIFDETCDHYPGEKDAKGKVVYLVIDDVSDNYEFSGVAVPCQEDAGSRRKAVDSTEIGYSLAALGETFTQEDYKLLLGLVKAAKDNNADVGTIFNDTIEDNTRMTEAEKLAAEQAAVEAAKAALEQAAVEAAKAALEQAAVEAAKAAESANLISIMTELAADMKALKEAATLVVEPVVTTPTPEADATLAVKAELATVMEFVKTELAVLKAELVAAKAEIAKAATKDELEAAKTVQPAQILTAAASANAVQVKTVLDSCNDMFVQKLLD